MEDKSQGACERLCICLKGSFADSLSLEGMYHSVLNVKIDNLKIQIYYYYFLLKCPWNLTSSWCYQDLCIADCTVNCYSFKQTLDYIILSPLYKLTKSQICYAKEC